MQVNQQQQQVLSLDTVLKETRARSLIIQGTRRGHGVTVWASNTDVPAELHAAIDAHGDELRRLIDDASPYVCPAAKYHWQEWHYEQRKFVCGVCARLRHYI